MMLSESGSLSNNYDLNHHNQVLREVFKKKCEKLSIENKKEKCDELICQIISPSPTSIYEMLQGWSSGLIISKISGGISSGM